MTEQKQVHIIARYELLQHPGYIVYTVRSSDGAETYQVCLVNGNVTGCSCKGFERWHHCYHADGLQYREALRAETERAAQFRALQAAFDYRYQLQPVSELAA